MRFPRLELQELTDYGLRYHVQVIPFLDGPAHIAFILKHPEYAKLRAFPDNNYELCTTNPDSYKLLFGIYDDLLAANKGVNYFVLSTDEPYYVGMADNAQCNEANVHANSAAWARSWPSSLQRQPDICTIVEGPSAFGAISAQALRHLRFAVAHRQR